MLQKTKNRTNKKAIIGWLIITASVLAIPALLLTNKATGQTGKQQTVKAVQISPQIQATGSIKSEEEVTLHFQTGGKLVYLAGGEGKTVYRGQTIASLDKYALQRQLSNTLNNYKITRDNFDQTGDNYADGILKAQQTYPYNYYSQANVNGDQRTTAIDQALARLLDQAQAGLNISVNNVELANYALELSNLTSPITGIIYHEDTTTVPQNISPAAGFTIINPKKPVFRADISQTEAAYVSIGANAAVRIDALGGTEYTGTVIKIYPAKVTMPDGSQVYQADIKLDELPEQAVYEMNGTAIIKSNTEKETMLVPAWTVISERYIWVSENGQAVLKEITAGTTRGQETEITSGLAAGSEIVTNPKTIIAGKYLIP